MTGKPQLLDYLATCAETADLSGLGKNKVAWYFRAVHPDLRSKNDFRYPWPGQWAEAPGPILKHTESCPQETGDGLCVAKTFFGASMGGIRFGTFLLVGVAKRDVLGEDDHKLRVRRMYVADLLDVRNVLSGANLSGADLSGANLSGADLYRANLSGADLYRANLYRADLSGADLSGADLSGADLYRANLYRADLSGADLYRADLSGADLYRANLSGADLYRANLSGADLSGAKYDQLTLWPSSFDPKAAGARSRCEQV